MARATLSGKQRIQGVDGVSGFLDVACETRDTLKQVLDACLAMKEEIAQLRKFMQQALESAEKGHVKADRVADLLEQDIALRSGH